MLSNGTCQADLWRIEVYLSPSLVNIFQIYICAQYTTAAAAATKTTVATIVSSATVFVRCC